MITPFAPRALVSGSGRLALIVLLLTPLFGCDKLPLLAPTQSTITLISSSAFVPVNGSTDILGNIIEQAGTPVQNGTLVTFTTNLGTIDPREARTHNGQVIVRFTAGSQSGTARIGAISGSARATEIELKVGGVAASRIALAANPTVLLSTGGTSEVIASVADASGNPLPGVPVTFSATNGTLAPVTSTTDSNGEARTRLTTTRESTVTASVGGAVTSGTGGGTGTTAPATGTVTVRVNSPPTVAIRSSTSSPVAGGAVTFDLTITSGTNSTPVQRVSIDFGDGETQSLGATGSTSIAHVYRSSGTYAVTVTVTDTAGERAVASTSVVVASRPPIGVTITATPTNPQIKTVVSFTANVTPSTASIESYQWSFGDGDTRTTSGSQTTHIYDTVGTKIVSVTAFGADGTIGRGVVEIFVQPAPP